MKAESIANLQNCSNSQREALESRGKNLPHSQRQSKANSPTFEPTACHSTQLNRSLNGSAFLPYSPLDPGKIQFFPQVGPSAFLSPRQYDLCVPEFSLWNQTREPHSNLRPCNRFAFSRLYTFNQNPAEVTNATCDNDSAHTFSRLSSIPVQNSWETLEQNDATKNQPHPNIASYPSVDKRFQINSEQSLGQSFRRQGPKEIDRPMNELRKPDAASLAVQELAAIRAEPNDSRLSRQTANADKCSIPDQSNLQKSPIFRQILGGTTPFKVLHPFISRKSVVSENEVAKLTVGKVDNVKEGIPHIDSENHVEDFQQSDWRSANLQNLSFPQPIVAIPESEGSLNHSIGQQAEPNPKKMGKQTKADLGGVSHHSKNHSVNTNSEHDHRDKPDSETKDFGARCTCKKSKCLKLYCECFAAQQVCQDACVCTECFNKEEYQDIRVYFLKETLEKNPNAFKSKFKKLDAQNVTLHTRGCNCKKTGCQKRYCECFGASTKCTSLCKCTECCNFGEETRTVGLEQYHERVLRKRKRKSRNFVQSLLERLNERQVHDRKANIS